MKRFSTYLAGLCLLAFIAVSCVKDVKEDSADPESISEETIAKIAALGFATVNVQRVDEGYLVEGDIILTEADLNYLPTSPTLLIAQEEQYRTYNLVDAPRSITVSVSGTVPNDFSIAVDAAIKRYNDESLLLTFSRVASGGNINIKIVNTGQYIASAGFPNSSGDPYGEIKYAKKYTTYGVNFMTTVVAHEIGHCIGFRHTDYMNRAYSCGGWPSNEGAGSVGAVHISGTPTGPDANSWMLACLSATTNRPFNSNDKKALGTLY